MQQINFPDYEVKVSSGYRTYILSCPAENKPLGLSDFNETQCRLLNTLTLIDKNMIQSCSEVSEMWPVELKSQGRVYSSRRIYSAEHGSTWWR